MGTRWAAGTGMRELGETNGRGQAQEESDNRTMVRMLPKGREGRDHIPPAPRSGQTDQSLGG